MKFLHKINRQYLWAITVLLVLLSVAGYFVLRVSLAEEIKESILEKEYMVVHEIKDKHTLPNIYPIIETRIIDKNKVKAKSYKKIYLTDELENELEPYLEYKNSVLIDGNHYLITLRHSVLGNNELILAIALPLLLILFLTFILLFFLIKKTNKSLWKDFEDNLEIIENFSIIYKESLSLKNTGIEEFNRLNKTVLRFTNKIQKDYSTLKEFTENASHELQTPLSVIQAKLELLVQDPDLTKEQAEIIEVVNSSITRLSKLTEGLLILAKIDNNQFALDSDINLSNSLNEKISYFEPFIKSKQLTLEVKIEPEIIVKSNSSLLDVLLSNLLNNAIKHNIPHGSMSIGLTKNALVVSNSGLPLEIEPETLFNRFQKASSKSTSSIGLGLGLAISKKVCEAMNWDISYSYSNGIHTLKAINQGYLV